VVKVNSPTSVTVQWDGSDVKFTYRFGAEEDGRKCYDVVVVDEVSDNGSKGLPGDIWKGVPRSIQTMALSVAAEWSDC
jgi:hypothetical protein